MYYKHWPKTLFNPEISHNPAMDPKPRTILLPISSLLRTGSEESNSEIHSEMLRLEDQVSQVPRIERDSNHTKYPSHLYSTIARQKSKDQGKLGIINLLNTDKPLEGTPSCISTNAQRTNFVKLSEGQYSITVSQLSMPPSASNTSLAHVEGYRYLKNAPTLQERAKREQQAAREQQKRE